MSSETPTDDTEREEWMFGVGDIVREKHAKMSPVPGESKAPKKEYRIKRRLVNPNNGKRFYHVEKEGGGTHLYSDGVMRQYERIEPSKSRSWSEETEVKRSVDADTDQQ